MAGFSKMELNYEDFITQMTQFIDNASVLADELFTGYFDRCSPSQKDGILSYRIAHYRYLCFSNILCDVLRDAAALVEENSKRFEEFRKKEETSENIEG